MNIAFIGHSYHQRTGSNRFFIEYLQKLGNVSEFYDTSWELKRAPWIDTFDSLAYDMVVIWQVAEAFDYIRCPHPNLVFAPMYDALERNGTVRWPDKYNQAKILCFSRELHRLISGRAPVSLYHQYFPNPAHHEIAKPGKGLRGLYWKRVRSVDETVVEQLCGGARFERFTIHDAPDPLSQAQLA